MTHMTPTLLRLLANGDQDQNTRTTVFPLNTGRWSFSVLWSRRNHSERWQLRTVFLMKRSVALCVLLRKCMYSKKRNGPICRDGYAHRGFLLCSRTDPLHSQHHGYQRHQLVSSTKAITTALRPYKQGDRGGSAPGVAWWRHGSRPRCHSVSRAGEDGTHLDTRWIAPGNRQKSRRDLDNHGLPSG